MLVANGELTLHPPIDLGRIISTVGAGDSFTAGFLVEYLESRDPVAATKAGNAVAGHYITHQGPEAVPTGGRLRELIDMQR